jgi:uncharacterized protein
MQRIADALTSIVCLMVDKPEAVKMEMISLDGQVQLQLTVDPGDSGKVIGKQGRNARAMRTLLQAMSMTSQQIISLDIVE